jgi:CrcB protein
MLADLAWIAVGGSLGALARYGVTVALTRLVPTFPLGTVTVNVTGSFLIGLAASLLAGGAGLPAATRPFFVVGFLGAYTTFSTYALDTLMLADRSALAAIGNIAASNVLSLAAVVAGAAVARLVD